MESDRLIVGGYFAIRNASTIADIKPCSVKTELRSGHLNSFPYRMHKSLRPIPPVDEILS